MILYAIKLGWDNTDNLSVSLSIAARTNKSFSLLVNFSLNYDLIYFSRSLYVLDDQEFVILLKAIKKAGVKEIIDLHGGIQKKSDPLRIIIKDSVKLFFRPFNFEIRKKGKFHGYSRSEKDLIALYEKSGWNVSQKIENYKNQEILFVLN